VGKDYVADRLVEGAGFKKLHIAAPWLLAFYASKGLEYHSYDDVPQGVKAHYRAEIQELAASAREKDPDVLIRQLDTYIGDRRGMGLDEPLVVSGVRFTNEALYGIRKGYFVVKVAVPDDLRRVRFIESGESLELFDDPFEAEIDGLPCHLEISGDLFGDAYAPRISAAYVFMRRLGEQVKGVA
jgi:hypothetical protein